MPVPTSPRFIDLFCGIGGFHQALAKLGARCVGACDNDDDARMTYLANHDIQTSKFSSDITQIDPKQWSKTDILCGGFPCQPFSQAGYKLGFSDTGRGNLFFEIMKIVDAQQPPVLFLENVRNLATHNNGQTLSTIQREIEKRGYSFATQVLKASDFNLPQHRPRLYMVCFHKQKVPHYAEFRFPKPIRLTRTMSDIFGAPCPRKIGFTLRVGGRHSPIGDRHNWDNYEVAGHEHRLTVEEGKRMMGLPKSFKFPVSERAAMKQLGNSVAVPVVRSVGKEILKVLLSRPTRHLNKARKH